MNIRIIFEYLGIDNEEQEHLANDVVFLEEVAKVHEFASANGMEYCLRGDEFRFNPSEIVEITENLLIYIP